MSVKNEIVVDGETYRRVDHSTANRVVMVIDRGWIFAGDLTEDPAEIGMLRLDRAVLIQRWESIGFDGMLACPESPKATLKRMPTPVIVPSGAEIFRVPVDKEWGL